jgi:hypothetical protein
MQHVIADRRDAQFAVEHEKASLSKTLPNEQSSIRLLRGDVGSSGTSIFP